MSVNLYKNGELIRIATKTEPMKDIVSTENDGLAPKVTNEDGFLKGDGTWVVPVTDGVKDIQPGETEGSISVDINGESKDVVIPGLGTLAFSSDTIPTKTSDLENDSGYKTEDTWRPVVDSLTSDDIESSLSAAQGKVLKEILDSKLDSDHKHVVADISDFPKAMPASDVFAWAKEPVKPTYTAAEVGALPDTTIIPKVSNTYSPTSTDGMTGIAINSALQNAIAAITQFNYAIVTELPNAGIKGTIYLIERAAQEEKEIYDEYLYIDNTWEKLGSTRVDLSNYYKKSEVDKIIADALEASDVRIQDAFDLVTWVGTKAEYEAESADIPEDSFVILTDSEADVVNPVPINKIRSLFNN